MPTIDIAIMIADGDQIIEIALSLLLRVWMHVLAEVESAEREVDLDVHLSLATIEIELHSLQLVGCHIFEPTQMQNQIARRAPDVRDALRDDVLLALRAEPAW